MKIPRVSKPCDVCGNDRVHTRTFRHNEPNKDLKRYRECLKCGNQFVTYEISEFDYRILIALKGTGEVLKSFDFIQERLEKVIALVAKLPGDRNALFIERGSSDMPQTAGTQVDVVRNENSNRSGGVELFRERHREDAGNVHDLTDC